MAWRHVDETGGAVHELTTRHGFERSLMSTEAYAHALAGVCRHSSCSSCVFFCHIFSSVYRRRCERRTGYSPCGNRLGGEDETFYIRGGDDVGTRVHAGGGVLVELLQDGHDQPGGVTLHMRRGDPTGVDDHVGDDVDVGRGPDERDRWHHPNGGVPVEHLPGCELVGIEDLSHGGMRVIGGLLVLCEL